MIGGCVGEGVMSGSGLRESAMRNVCVDVMVVGGEGGGLIGLLRWLGTRGGGGCLGPPL